MALRNLSQNELGAARAHAREARRLGVLDRRFELLGDGQNPERP